MIEFGMGSTFLTFTNGNVEVDNRGLTIGGYESAWLADLVIAYILDELEHLFHDSIFYGSYRDDGLCIFIGNKTKKRYNRMTF